MYTEIIFKIKNIKTGETRQIDTFKGMQYSFVADYMKERSYSDDLIEINNEMKNYLIAQAFVHLRKYGFDSADLGDDYGVVGFIKMLSLIQFYKDFGYALMIEVDF